MPTDSEFTAEELEIMKELDEAEGVEPEADPEPDETQEPAPAAAASEAPEQTPAATAAPTEPEQEPNGNLSVALKKDRNALRAARHDARQARQEAERLRAELEDARKAIPAQRDEADDVLAELEEDAPQVVAVVKALKAEIAELKGAKAPQAEATPAFVPDMLPPELQAAVDEVDELADWQADPNQAMWNAAKRADGMLYELPAWRSRPPTERLAEAVRLVKQQASATTTTQAAAPARDPKQAARDAINNAPRQPLAIGDLRGGAAPKASGPNYGAMTDEEIIASL